MRFLLRCIFWLSIVYASILWPTQALQMRDDVMGLRASMTPAGTLAGVADLCRGRRAVDCADDAAHLTALLARATGYGEPGSDRADTADMASNDAPISAKMHASARPTR